MFIFILNNNSFVSNNIFFNNDFFISIRNDVFLSTLINELIINLILQKIRLFNLNDIKFNFIDLKTKHKRFLDCYFNFRIAKNLFVDFFINLIAFFNYNSTIIKICLTFFVKINFVDFYKSKIYKKTITNTQHKIN